MNKFRMIDTLDGSDSGVLIDMTYEIENKKVMVRGCKIYNIFDGVVDSEAEVSPLYKLAFCASFINTIEADLDKDAN